MLWGDTTGYVWGRRNEKTEVPIQNIKQRQTYYGALNLYQGCSTLESLVGEEPVEVEGIVIEAQADITDAIETQQVEGKATQQGKDPGIMADAAGILAQGDIPNIVKTVLDAPMGADGVGGVGRR